MALEIAYGLVVAGFGSSCESGRMLVEGRIWRLRELLLESRAKAKVSRRSLGAGLCQYVTWIYVYEAVAWFVFRTY